MPEQESLTLKFEREKETANTVRYKEEGPDAEAKVGYIYLKNATVAQLSNPHSLKITIEVGA